MPHQYDQLSPAVVPSAKAERVRMLRDEVRGIVIYASTLTAISLVIICIVLVA